MLSCRGSARPAAVALAAGRGGRAPGRIRTSDQELRRLLLCPLSYGGPSPSGSTASPRGLTSGPRQRYPDLSAERVKGIEPSPPAWKAGALPLSYTRRVNPHHTSERRIQEPPSRRRSSGAPSEPGGRRRPRGCGADQAPQCGILTAPFGGCGGKVDAPGLGPGGHSPWGFESLHPHRATLHPRSALTKAHHSGLITWFMVRTWRALTGRKRRPAPE